MTDSCEPIHSSPNSSSTLELANSPTQLSQLSSFHGSSLDMSSTESSYGASSSNPLFSFLTDGEWQKVTCFRKEFTFRFAFYFVYCRSSPVFGWWWVSSHSLSHKLRSLTDPQAPTVLRVLWNILRGGSAEDVRSDDEDDGEDDDGLIDEDDLDALPNDREVPTTEPKKDR